MNQLIFFIVAKICFLGLSQQNNSMPVCNSHPMGISINLYRVDKAEKIEDLKNMEAQLKIAETTKVDLYKMTEDLAIIFTNKADPFSDQKSIPYKMLFGNQTRQEVDRGQIGGFLPAGEIHAIVKWIRANQLNSFESFTKIYDALSVSAKQRLVDIGSPTRKELFEGYVQPLVAFYFLAFEHHNSIIFVAQ